MNQTRFNLRLRVEEVYRLGPNRVKVFARGPVGEGLSINFKMDTSERCHDTPTVNDDIMVTITTPISSELDLEREVVNA